MPAPVLAPCTDRPTSSTGRAMRAWGPVWGIVIGCLIGRSKKLISFLDLQTFSLFCFDVALRHSVYLLHGAVALSYFDALRSPIFSNTEYCGVQWLISSLPPVPFLYELAPTSLPSRHTNRELVNTPNSHFFPLENTVSQVPRPSTRCHITQPQNREAPVFFFFFQEQLEARLLCHAL